MSELNQDVIRMIEQIRARLVDLEEDVRACTVELPDMAKRLDRIDDRVYLLETEVASRVEAARNEQPDAGEQAAGKSAEQPAEQPAEKPAATSSEKASTADDGDGEDDNGMNILTPEAKEAIGETVGDLREIGRTGLETITELNEAFADIAGPFKSFTRMGRRR